MPFGAKTSRLREAVENELRQNEQQRKLGLSDSLPTGEARIPGGKESGGAVPLESLQGGFQPKNKAAAASPAQPRVDDKTRFRIRHPTLGWFAAIKKTEWEGCKFTEEWTPREDKSPSFTLEELRSRQLMSLLVSGYTGLKLVEV